MDFQNIASPISRGEIDVLYQLFACGPTYDGNIIGKQSRDELVKRGFAIHKNGYAFLTEAGFDYAMLADMSVKKDKVQM